MAQRFKFKNSDRIYKLGFDSPILTANYSPKQLGEELATGGYPWKNGIDGQKVDIPPGYEGPINKDIVKTILEPGELVIPLKYVPLVTKFLRSKNISFGNFK